MDHAADLPTVDINMGNLELKVKALGKTFQFSFDEFTTTLEAGRAGKNE